MAWKVKTDIRDQTKHGLWDSSMKTGNIKQGVDRSKFLVLFWAKRYIIVSDWSPYYL